MDIPSSTLIPTARESGLKSGVGTVHQIPPRPLVCVWVRSGKRGGGLPRWGAQEGGYRTGRFPTYSTSVGSVDRPTHVGGGREGREVVSV